MDVFDCISAPSKTGNGNFDPFAWQIDFLYKEKNQCSQLAHKLNTAAVLCDSSSAKSTGNDDKTGSPAKIEEFKGSIYLIGGNAKTTFAELVKQAGNDAKVAVVGRASSIEGYEQFLADGFVKAGVKPENITIIVPKDQIPEDPNYNYSYELPTDADLVYFGGGAQDKLRREFDDHQLDSVKKLLENGAIIAGNSAGTAVMPKEIINGGDENKVEESEGFGLTPWAIFDTHVGERHRETRDVRALYQLGKAGLPVIGIDEDTSVQFKWKNGSLSGVVSGAGNVHIFQKPDLPPLTLDEDIKPQSVKDPAGEEALMWDLKSGNSFEVIKNK